jgi:hypothetical protein
MNLKTISAYTVNLCLVTIKYKNPSWPSEIRIWFQGVNISTKCFYFSQIGIYILKIHLSTWNLDYMIPTGIIHTSVQNSTYESQKRNLSSIQENISSIQNYQGLSFLPVTLNGLADVFPQLGSWHGQLCGTIEYLALMVQWQILASDIGVLSSNPGCEVFFHDDIPGA